MPFFDIFASPRWSPLRMRTKVVSFFFFFSRAFKQKKIKALRPKMTKIASRRGPALRERGEIDWLIDIFYWKPNRLRVPSSRESFVSGKGVPKCSLLPSAIFLFLHETGLESLKIISARCFSLKCQRKDSKKAKEHRQFHGVLGRWRTAAIDLTTFHVCQRCRKTVVFAVFSHLWGVIWHGEKSLSWPAMPVSNKKQEFEQRKRSEQTVRWLLSACVPIRFCPSASR